MNRYQRNPLLGGLLATSLLVAACVVEDPAPIDPYGLEALTEDTLPPECNIPEVLDVIEDEDALDLQVCENDAIPADEDPFAAELSPAPASDKGNIIGDCFRWAKKKLCGDKPPKAPDPPKPPKPPKKEYPDWGGDVCDMPVTCKNALKWDCANYLAWPAVPPGGFLELYDQCVARKGAFVACEASLLAKPNCGFYKNKSGGAVPVNQILDAVNDGMDKCDACKKYFQPSVPPGHVPDALPPGGE